MSYTSQEHNQLDLAFFTPFDEESLLVAVSVAWWGTWLPWHKEVSCVQII